MLRSPCHLGVCKAGRNPKSHTNLAVSRTSNGEESKGLHSLFHSSPLWGPQDNGAYATFLIPPRYADHKMARDNPF